MVFISVVVEKMMWKKDPSQTNGNHATEPSTVGPVISEWHEWLSDFAEMINKHKLKWGAVS